MKVYLGLGSNLGDREKNMLYAIKEIGERVGEVLKISSFYETIPCGFESKNLFLNAAILIESNLAPLDMLQEIHTIEQSAGKHLRSSREEIYQDRPIDIDILFIEDKIYDFKELIIPHPLLQGRDFVLRPLCEIAPEFIHPILKISIKELLSRLERQESNEE